LRFEVEQASRGLFAIAELFVIQAMILFSSFDYENKTCVLLSLLVQ